MIRAAAPVVAVGLVLVPTAAGASTTTTTPSGPSVTVTSPIQSGSDAVTVGSATFTRTSAAGGSAVIAVHGSVPKGIKESELCYGTRPFTGRASPGQCQLSQGATGSAADYQVTVTGDNAGQTIYFQFHFDTGDTAYAGWHPGNPFYGNVAVVAPEPPTPVPVGALGGMGVAAVAGLAFARATRRRRRTPAAPGTAEQIGRA